MEGSEDRRADPRCTWVSGASNAEAEEELARERVDGEGLEDARLNLAVLDDATPVLAIG